MKLVAVDAPLFHERMSRRRFVETLVAGGVSLAAAPMVLAGQRRTTVAQGTVYHDRDGDGRRGAGDVGLEGVAVSNGRDVTLTDEKGIWRLPVVNEESTTFFVIKPRGWRTPLGPANLPRFYYIHQPNGSPAQRFAGVRPTGPLPESIDLALEPQEEGERFSVLFCGDPQPRDAREVDYLAQTVVPELRGAEAAFGVSLGDIMFDNLSHYGRLTEAFRWIGRPWYHVLGNHDLNFDSPDNRHAFETFRSVFGPSYFAFDHGPVHFLVLNNIEWTGESNDGRNRGRYRGLFGQEQLEFVANDLKHVPPDRQVVLLMHIPLWTEISSAPSVVTNDREQLFRLIEQRPRTLSFSAHMHWLGHQFLGPEQGWRGPQPHHHIVAGALCGSWFSGAPNEQGIPHSTMSDGTPRGYLKVDFDGARHNINGYQVLGRSSDYQMNVEAPTQIALAEAAQTAVFVNVFNGSDRSKVRMRVGAAAWRPLEQVRQPDPAYVRLHERDKGLTAPYRALPDPDACLHLWTGSLPDDLAGGTHLIEVESEDMFGNVHRGSRLIRVG